MASQYVDDHQRVKESGLLAEATVGRSTASMSVASDKARDPLGARRAIGSNSFVVAIETGFCRFGSKKVKEKRHFRSREFEDQGTRGAVVDRPGVPGMVRQ